MKENKDDIHIRELLLATFTPHFFKEFYEQGFIKMNNCNYKYDFPELLSAAKKKTDKICLWCGGKLKNDNDSFCSVYCASMWNGECN